MDKLTYIGAFQLSVMIGKLKVDSYDEMELVRSKKEQLKEALKPFHELYQGDEKKAAELQSNESELTKGDIAYMSKPQFKEAIFKRGFNGDEVDFLEYWLVKE